MALTKGFLLEIGVPQELTSAIMTEHGKVQSGLLKQIDERDKRLEEQEETYRKAADEMSKELKAQRDLNERVSSEHAAAIAAMRLEAACGDLIADAGVFDKGIVLSLIDLSAFDADSETFQTDFEAALNSLRSTKPFLFKPSEIDNSQVDESDTSTTRAKLQGFVPAQGTNKDTTKADSPTFTRIGMEMMPDVTNVFNFDTVSDGGD